MSEWIGILSMLQINLSQVLWPIVGLATFCFLKWLGSSCYCFFLGFKEMHALVHIVIASLLSFLRCLPVSAVQSCMYKLPGMRQDPHTK